MNYLTQYYRRATTEQRFFSKTYCIAPMAQILKPIRLSVMSVIMIVSVIALYTELTEYEEIAKLVVIPALAILCILSGYLIFKSAIS